MLLVEYEEEGFRLNTGGGKHTPVCYVCSSVDSISHDQKESLYKLKQSTAVGEPKSLFSLVKFFK